ncbi:MAG: hypothetical protein E7623_06705 [Ruminococcaceae bacterium]|nr:hypothetical protein [Oscillospiraceae bacterium]
MNTSEFLEKYSDTESYGKWISDHIKSKNDPPLSFNIGLMPSSELQWEKQVGKTHTVTDYEKTDRPVKRHWYMISYTAKDAGIKVNMKVTYYPDYPVVEYAPVITNIAKTNSPLIKDVLAMGSPVIENSSEILLHTFKGSVIDPDEYHPYEHILTESSSKHIEVTRGVPSAEFMPNFNFEDKASQKGVIAVLGWQGKWKADFELKNGCSYLNAGEYRTEFVLLPNESYKAPIMILLFYKGEHIDGQNVYRRWLYDHNIMREQGVRDGSRVMLCISDYYYPSREGNGHDDVYNIEKLKETGLNEYIDEFCQDAGWYNSYGDWHNTGNWYPDPERYPDGMGVVGEACKKAGILYHVWFEPERLRTWTKETIDLKDAIIGCHKGDDGQYHFTEPCDLKRGETVLTNYAIPKAVNYTIEWVNRLIDEFKIGIYRQDCNIEPGNYWDAYDEKMSREMGIPRYGLTEEKHCKGYMRLWQSVIDRHPGILIDSCASGGMRHDIETIRYSYPHTRTDWWNILENTQDHTYGAAQWLVLMGGACPQTASLTPPDSFDPYQWRSETVTSTAFGFNFLNPMTDEKIETIKQVIRNWKRFASYMLYDFYPLTPYDQSKASVCAFEYDSPEKGEGMLIVYLRPEFKGEFTVYPTRLSKNEKYLVHDEDGLIPDIEISGKDFMEKGIKVESGDKATAPWFTYKRI